MATYYIATDGLSTNDGSIGSPYDLSTGLESIRASDTVYVRGGTYYPETKIYPGLVNGATQESERMTVVNYNNEEVWIDCTNVTDWSDPDTTYIESVIGLTNYRSFITFDGINIENSRAMGFAVWYFTDNIIFRNCHTRHTQSSGIMLSGSNNCIVEDCEVEDFTYLGNHEGISIIGGTGHIVRNNYVHDIGNENAHNNGIGIDFKNSASGDCYGNTVHNTKIVGIYVDCRGGVSTVNIYNNRVYNVDGSDYPTGHGIIVADEDWEAGGVIENTRVYNNIVTDCVSSGIGIGWGGDVGTEINNSFFVNNVIYDCGAGFLLMTTSSDGGTTPNPSSNNSIANNIINNCSSSFATSGVAVNLDSFTVDTNFMIGTLSGLTIINPIADDPLFVDPTNNDFTLQQTSTAINAGTDAYIVPTEDFNGDTRPIGIVDIGAYENQEGETMTGNFRLTGKAFSSDLGIMKRALTVDELAYLDTTPSALGIIANGGTDANLPNLTQADFSNYVAFDEGVGTAHDDITASDYTLDDGAVWVEV